MADLFIQIANNFHFIRPELLWFFVPILLLVLLVFRKSKDEDDWKKNIPEHLANYLVVKGKENSKLPRVLLILMFSLIVIGASGPTWKEIDKPGVEAKSSVVIALDLSLSMNVKDIQPSRIERAKLKLKDFLSLPIGAPAALVGFAGTAHTILHFTSDYKTIDYLLEYTSPEVMPLQGSNLEAAIILSDSLISETEVPGTLFLITDEIDVKQISLINDFVSNTKNRAEIYFISTPTGGTVPKGKNSFVKHNGVTVSSRLNTNLVGQLDELENVNVNLLTLDESDIERIARNIRRNLDFEKKNADEQTEWEEYGYWFMMPAFLILLFWFRKGWVVNWIFIIVSLPGLACSGGDENNSRKNTFADLWYTNDYQAQMLFDDGKYLEAANLFEDNFMKAVSYYKAKDFENAVQLFYLEKTPQGYFNVGLCMAELENWPEAIFAFEEALKLYPDYEEAKDNLEKVKALIPKKKEIELVTPQSFEDKFISRSEELDQESDEEGDEEETSGGEKTEEELGAAMAQQNQEITFPDGSEPQQNPEDQKNTILKQLSDDPSVFLKRKFKMQYDKLKKEGKVSTPDKKW